MFIKQYKKYADVPKKYQWDLILLLEGKTIKKTMEILVNNLQKEIIIKDLKYNSPQEFLKGLKLKEKNERIYYKLSNYLFNSLSQNVVDPKILAWIKKFEFEIYNYKKMLGSEDVRFFKNAKKLIKWVKLPEFKDYKKIIKAKLEEQKHQLSNEIEEFRILESRADISSSEVFNILTNAETKYGYAQTSSGKNIKVTNANINSLIKHHDDKVRKTAKLVYRKGILEHKETFTNLLYQHFKNITTWTKLRNFSSTIDSLIFDDRINQKLLQTLFLVVKSNIKIFKNKNKWHKKFYKKKFNKNLTQYDWMVDLVKTKSKYTLEEAKKITLKAFQPFGKEYINVVKKAYEDNWIDFMPVKNKHTGAFSISNLYNFPKKFILMNFDGNLTSITTLAHEIGHSIHSYFSDTYQPQSLANYPIILAEIASTFNELMLFDYLLENSKNIKEKFHILNMMINEFEGTIVRQTMWAEYEVNLYQKIEEGNPVASYEAISKLYFEITKDYETKKTPKYNSKENYHAISVPHFYYSFYVYKYAIGQLVANIFFNKYKQEGAKALQIYIKKFLSAGESDWPLDILKKSGIDLYDLNTYQVGFDQIKNVVNEWIKLGKIIFKI